MRQNIINTISAFFIFLFFYTGISKLLDMENFRYALSKSPLLRHWYPLLAYSIPIIEIWIAGALLFDLLRTGTKTIKRNLLSCAILMGCFTIYIFYMVEFRNDRPCTCGGIISQMNWHQHMYFNFFSTLVAITAIILNNKELKSIRR